MGSITEYWVLFLEYLAADEFALQVTMSLVKFAVILAIVLQLPPIMVWAERRAPAMMQRRKGPNRVGIGNWRLYGLMQSFADTVKLIWKEEVVPAGSNKFFYHVAPLFGVIPAILVAMAIPYGNDINVLGYVIPMSVINVDVGFLFIFAISSLGVYAVTIAGWACNNKYSLMGSLRASAQMISYEIPLALSLIPIVLLHGTLDLNTIVINQGANPLKWGVFWAPFSFILFVVCMFAETNRAPFDLAEAESELVAGFHTEFNSAKFAAFFLAEYVVMFVLACLASVAFFGGWQIPFLPTTVMMDFFTGVVGLEYAWATVVVSLLGMGCLLTKAAFFMWLYIWVRWTLPRFRYDQLMSLGWKFLMPIGLANVFAYAIIALYVSY